MKKNYFLFTFLLFTLTTIAQSEIRITTIIEGDCPNIVSTGETVQTAPSVVELYISRTVDISDIELQSQFSFATFWTANSSIGTGEYTDSYIYVVNDLDAFDREFPGIRTETNTIEGTILTSAGGGDKLRLIDTANNDTVLDIYGVDNTDGSNESWN